MRHFLLPMLLPLVASSCAYGAPPAPSRAPAPQRAPLLLVMPFQALGGARDYDWVGRGIREDLIVEAMQVVAVRPARSAPPARPGAAAPATPPQTKPRGGAVQGDQEGGEGEDVAAIQLGAALRAGRQAGASLVAFGTFQVADGGLRVIGHLLDVESGRSLGTLKATGKIAELFRVQDQLSSQLLELLRASLEPPATDDDNDDDDAAAAPVPARRTARVYSPYTYSYAGSYGYDPYGYDPYVYDPYYSRYAYSSIYFLGAGLSHHDVHHTDHLIDTHRRTAGHLSGGRVFSSGASSGHIVGGGGSGHASGTGHVGGGGHVSSAAGHVSGGGHAGGGHGGGH